MTNGKEVGKIYETSDYSQFSFRKDNRPVKETNVLSKIESIKMMGQKQPITVDKNGRVIDGQHRLEACKKLNIPVKYIIDEKRMSTQEIADLQSSSISWKPDDYASSFASTGNDSYKLYVLFSQAYPEFAHSCRLTMLENTYNRNHGAENKFKAGMFVVKSYKKACQYAEALKKIGAFYEGYNRRSFVCAVLYMMDNPEFSFERFMRKLPKRRRELMDFSKTEDYIEALQKIYNWKETKKVYFV